MNLDQRGRVQAEYVWIDSNGGTRSKTKVRDSSVQSGFMNLSTGLVGVAACSYLNPRLIEPLRGDPGLSTRRSHPRSREILFFHRTTH
jgi:hypothetical protein